jgi:hypothetical protein
MTTSQGVGSYESAHDDAYGNCSPVWTGSDDGQRANPITGRIELSGADKERYANRKTDSL